mmetsp:Transcript_22951/g.34217  ORF Transcript_22951/g.34217 Transcript_22951/m.34217 type:complete len:93 (+) Transcript_22951:1405-1683(+)
MVLYCIKKIKRLDKKDKNYNIKIRTKKIKKKLFKNRALVYKIQYTLMKSNLHKSIFNTPKIYSDPLICKDYVKYGYCTYGNTCKFMHERRLY